ncbi:hypothetical protein BO226_17875 [Rhodococcus sp. 2G]|uniref:hypothetical protein n=1 Tax=unclassified Rhodococcus (in: high G+C Gram-positive bacteria) TaxID=192944 RepID=UPI0007D9FC4A|nr:MULTISPECIES: hypothetical protein [unclassified Rhodococcus (in: high G+C Gram-positive bacteria)]APE10838.1 hypothetical protein BO226_17875 [Rhodococcus sp. 2G]
MSLDTRVFGDPTSCYACADSLADLATGVNDRLKSARDGRTESEFEFGSPAGDAFRTTLDRIITGTTEAADQIDVISAALRAFADGLVTARSRMSQAEATAAEAGIPVEFGVGIGDPIDIDPNSYDIAPQVLRAKQIAAYEASAGLVAEGRAAETAAHSALAEALRGPTTILKDAEAQWGWLLAHTVGGYIAATVAELSKWGNEAATRGATLARLRELAAEAARIGDPYPEATAARAVRAFQGGADDAARFAAENSRLLAGLGDNKFVQLFGKNVDSFLPEGSALSKIGSKIPVVGLALTGLQTFHDVSNADDSTEAVEAVAKNVGGFVAGTVATELILASAAGGPVTLLAVGAGVGVAFGVGEVIEHWDDISGAAGSAARWVGNLF